MAAYDNHVLPFLWLKGEARETIVEYLEQIAGADIREVCLESRTHPEFCRDGWWSDLRFIIGECKRLGLKIWLLDDAHFPTGYANGALAGEDVDPALKKTMLKHRTVTVVGPQPSTVIKLGNLMDWKNSTSSFRSSGSSRMSSKPVGRMTIYNGDILEEDSDDYTDSELSELSDVSDDANDNSNYEYTYENTEKPFEDAQRLQALWSIARDRNMLRTLMKTLEFKQWKMDHDTNMSNKEFMVALLRGQVPLNTEDVTGLVFFDTLDVMDLYNLYDEFGENTSSAIDDFNAKYGSPIVWDDQMPYEVAYPDVFDWIKDVLDLD